MMKVILMSAVTIDGKLARDEGHYVDWTAPEDKKLFFSTSKRAGVLILGNNTYKTFPAPLPGRLHIVLTRAPESKIGMPNVVEYTNDPPERIVEKLEERGYTEAVLTGGAQINALFLRAKLVDEIWLTLEPLIFGEGVPLFDGGVVDEKARLIEVKRLNEGGTVLLKYGLR